MPLSFQVNHLQVIFHLKMVRARNYEQSHTRGMEQEKTRKMVGEQGSKEKLSQRCLSEPGPAYCSEWPRVSNKIAKVNIQLHI